MEAMNGPRKKAPAAGDMTRMVGLRRTAGGRFRWVCRLCHATSGDTNYSSALTAEYGYLEAHRSVCVRRDEL